MPGRPPLQLPDPRQTHVEKVKARIVSGRPAFRLDPSKLPPGARAALGGNPRGKVVRHSSPLDLRDLHDGET